MENMSRTEGGRPTEMINRGRWAGRLLAAACVSALVGSVVSAVHFVWPNALAFATFMLVGQGAFGLAMGLWGVVLFRDLRMRRMI